MYKGIEKNQNYTWLICAAQNMKNIANKVRRNKKKEPNWGDILNNYVILIVYIGRLIIKWKDQRKLSGLCLRSEY